MGDLNPGSLVRIKNDHSKIGSLLRVFERRGKNFAEVQFAHAVQKLRVSQIEPLPSTPVSSIDVLAEGKFSGPDKLRNLLAHVRLSGRLADVIYSMEATNTDFYAHQFKPVLKILASPTGNILVADEVGLGKTIEAGLIWTELAARSQFRNLLVVCPRVLCEKWRSELREKFGLDAQIMNSAELLDTLKSDSARRRGFAAVCGMQGLRPPKQWREGGDTGTSKSAELANLLSEARDDVPLIDMLIVDEAHHMRNPETQTAKLGKLLSDVAEHVVLLSATPIHLQNRDLHSLLRFVDEITFRDESALDQLIAANQPLLLARESILRGEEREKVLKHVQIARTNRLLLGNKQLQGIENALVSNKEELTWDERAEIANRLERSNLLSNVVNRTRRRDVEDFRVVRKVYDYPATMSPIERAIYDDVTKAIQQAAFEADLPTGFLVVTPQRMLASCLPATIAHWRGARIDLGSDEPTDFVENDDGYDGEGLIRSSIRRSLPRDLDLKELEKYDSKFLEFRKALLEHLENHPDEKVIVFSTFRATLAYLNRRLSQDGVPSSVMSGQVKDRSKLLADFRASKDINVLLSSEVGSEGIDLQFSRTVINYDLPWNPMRVEQRIGRVDRLGQEADTISVINLFHRDTIDARIYERLYRRLNLCEQALGGFEDILGQQIPELTSKLLSGRLSRSEENEMIEQTSRALAQRQRIEKELEKEAAGLIAHGDYVLKSIREARDEHRWISDADLVEYLRHAFGTLYPGSEVRKHRQNSTFEIRLTPQAQNKFENWCRAQNFAPGEFARSSGWVECHIGRAGKKRSRHPNVTQTHPIVRFISSCLNEAASMRTRPAIALSIAKSEVATLSPGIYVVVIQLWKFGDGPGQERLAYAGVNVETSEKLTASQAQQLVSRSVQNARLWHEAQSYVDLKKASDLAKTTILEDLTDDFEDACEEHAAEIDDRIQIQLNTLEEKYRERRRKLEQRIDEQRRRGQPDAVLRLTEGQLKKLDETTERRRIEIRNQQAGVYALEDIATVIARLGE